MQKMQNKCFKIKFVGTKFKVFVKKDNNVIQ